MKIVIINGSARKGNTLTAINAFIKGASEKNEIEIIEPDKLNRESSASELPDPQCSGSHGTEPECSAPRRFR